MASDSSNGRKNTYQIDVEFSSRRGHPNLKYLVDFMNHEGQGDRRVPWDRPTCTVLAFRVNNEAPYVRELEAIPNNPPFEFANEIAMENEEHHRFRHAHFGFDMPTRSAASRPGNRSPNPNASMNSAGAELAGIIFILEGLSTEWIEYLGSNLHAPPELFLAQVGRKGQNRNAAQPSTILLPSTRYALKFTTLQYFDAISLKGHFPRGRQPILKSIDNNGRRSTIEVNLDRRIRIRGPTTDESSSPVTVALVDRIISAWSTQLEDHRFAGVVLVDPPLPLRLRLQYRSSPRRFERHVDIRWSTYGGGHVNFDDFPLDFYNIGNIGDELSSRLRALADVGYSHRDAVEQMMAIQQKIVLSKWMVTLMILQREYNALDLDSLDEDSISPQKLAKSLDDLMAARRLLTNCIHRVDHSLPEVGVTQENIYKYYYTNDGPPNDHQLLGRDWNFLLQELRAFKSDTDSLIGTFMKVLQIHDSKRVDWVNKLAGTFVLIYTPIGTAYGILSMGGDFAPGQKNFWIFFIVALPLIAATLLVLYLWQWILQFGRSRSSPIDITKKDLEKGEEKMIRRRSISKAQSREI